jgi:protein-S-isoprenylcysteine O-methyltransferase Ste14
MALIKRNWTAQEAEEWTKEDAIASILSAVVYFLFTLGIAFSALLMPLGFIMVGVGVLLTLLMIYVINPKLSVISTDFEKKQHRYLEELEKQVKWEE